MELNAKENKEWGKVGILYFCNTIQKHVTEKLICNTAHLKEVLLFYI